MTTTTPAALTIDTPEFRELLGNYVWAKGAFSESEKVHRKSLIAHIDAKLTAASPAVPIPCRVIADWEPCNPVCDESPEMRNGNCSCDAAKASICRQLAAQEPAPATQQAGSHHLTPENVAAVIADLREIESGTPAVPLMDRDWRTWAGVLARIIDHLASPAATEASGAAVPDAEPPSKKQEKLRALADRIDHEKLWKGPMMYRDRLTDDQRDRLDAGIMLRRYSDLLAPGRWLVIPPEGCVQFSAGSLDKVTEMAKRDQERTAAIAAAPAVPEQTEKP